MLIRVPMALSAVAASLVATIPLSAQDTLNWQLPLPPVHCVSDDGRIPVLLVGSYHMSNPGADRFNLESDDVLVPKRQAEIAVVVERIARFQPTKVAVEAPWGDSATMARYADYLSGSRELRRSEEEQIGFRLAKRLGHARIYPIDVKMDLGGEALGPLIGANPEHGRRMAALDRLGAQAMRIMANWLAEGTIGHMLYNMNRPEMLARAHEPYLQYFLPIIADTNYAGADMVATWYRRNIRIFGNLQRIAEPGDRIFVIYGQGHIKIIQDLVQDDPRFCVEDALGYLTE